MRLTGEKLTLSEKRRRSNPWRILVLVGLIGAGFLILRAWRSGEVQPLFSPTPTPTRTSISYAEEAAAHFSAGNLGAAIAAYQEAVDKDSSNGHLWAEMARVQTYASDLLTTLAERRDLLSQAREAVNRAIELSPDDSFAYAVRTLVYDWSATSEVKDQITVGDLVRVTASLIEGGRLQASVIELEGSGEVGEATPAPADAGGESFIGVVDAIGEEGWVIDGRTIYISPVTLIREKNRRETFLAEADQSAIRSNQLDPENLLAFAYRAEVLIDQGNVNTAADLAVEAINRAAGSSIDPQYLMDIYRVYATVLENQGNYVSAIQQYQRATEIAPNLTFLYLRIGANYRTLAARAPNPAARRELVDLALDNFDKATRINEQLGIEDPNPYLAIGRTYAQDGEFFIAALNMERAVQIDPSNSEIYARLATVYFQARNYESSIDTFRCALDGCSQQETGDLLCGLNIYRCDAGTEAALEAGQVVRGLPLTDESVEYYYTYGSALTFYAGDKDHPEACLDAERIFQQLMEKYGSDELIRAIVEEGRAVCAAPQAGESTPTSSTEAPPTLTPTP
ncbi:MAG: tetratricopeptide repeat protein [Anaerolineales bacterium]